MLSEKKGEEKMKAIVRVGDFGGKVEVLHGKAVISSERDDFIVCMEEVSVPAVENIMVFPRDLVFEIEQKDGWVIDIRRGIYEKEHLIITRFKRPKPGGTLTSEYLTRDGRWLPKLGYGPYPPDITKIPIPALEKTQA